MTNKTLKKYSSLVLLFTLMVNIFPKTIYAKDINVTAQQSNAYDLLAHEKTQQIAVLGQNAPRSAMRIEMQTSIDDQAGIDGYEEIDVKVTWLESMAMQEPVTIAVTNDAQILVKDISDITFVTNGIQKSISNLTIEEGVVKFMTDKAVGRSICTLTFKVRAPIAVGEFKISTKVAADKAVNTASNYIEKTFNVTSGLTVETTYETIYSDTIFNVFGLVNYRTQGENPDLVISLDVYNEKTGEFVYELTGADYPTENTYDIASLAFPDNCEDGTYVVHVTLADGWKIIGSATKKINYIKFPLTVNTSLDIINGKTPFDVFGLVKYKSIEQNPDLVISLDVYNKETEDIVYELTGVDFPLDSTYQIESLVFPDYCENGVYVMHLTIAEGMNIIGSAFKEVTYIK